VDEDEMKPKPTTVVVTWQQLAEMKAKAVRQ
jgi:hypothetical protein